VKPEHEVVAFAPGPGRVHAEDELDPVAAQRLGERLAERRRLAGEHMRLALDQRDLAAEAAHDLRELEPGRSTAEHDQPLGHRPHGVASRVLQIPSSSRRPGTGGTIGSAPVASTTCWTVYRTPSTSTTPVPTRRLPPTSALSLRRATALPRRPSSRRP